MGTANLIYRTCNRKLLANNSVSQQDVNGEKLAMKKWWIFGADLFHGLRRAFHGL